MDIFVFFILFLSSFDDRMTDSRSLQEFLSIRWSYESGLNDLSRICLLVVIFGWSLRTYWKLRRCGARRRAVVDLFHSNQRRHENVALTKGRISSKKQQHKRASHFSCGSYLCCDCVRHKKYLPGKNWPMLLIFASTRFFSSQKKFNLFLRCLSRSLLFVIAQRYTKFYSTWEWFFVRFHLVCSSWKFLFGSVIVPSTEKKVNNRKYCPRENRTVMKRKTLKK